MSVAVEDRLDESEAERAAGCPDPGLVLALLLCSTYFLASSTLAVIQHLTFHTRARDMGIYAQILWNASQGRGLASTLLMENTNHLAEHVAPILFLLAPVYGLIPNPAWLVILQQLFLAASGLPVFLLARHVLGGSGPALIVLLGYLAMPALSRIALSEFHPVVMAALPVGLAGYATFVGRWRLALAASVIAMLFEEETTLVIFGLGISWVLIHRRWLKGAVLAGLAAAWLAVTVLLVMPSYQDQASRAAGNRTAGHYDTVRRDPLGATLGYVRERGPDSVGWVLLPQAGLGLLAPQVLIAALPDFLLLFFQDRPSTYGGHWAAAMLPISWMAAASGLARLRHWRPAAGRLGLAVLPLVAVGNFVLNSQFPGGRAFDADRFEYTQLERDLAQALEQVPPDARLIATRRAVPHLANRPEVWQFPLSLYSPGFRPDAMRQDFYVLDLNDSMTRRTLEDLNGDTVLTRRPRYHVRQYGESILLLSRPQPIPRLPAEAQAADLAVLRGYEVERLADEVRVRAYWDPLRRAPSDYVRVLRLTDDQGTLLAEQVTIPLETVLPPTRWERGQIVAEQSSVPRPEGYRGPALLWLGWRDGPGGRPLRFADGSEFVEVARLPEL